MRSPNLPNIERVKRRYGLNYEQYSVFMYHPVTLEIEALPDKISNVVDAILSPNGTMLSFSQITI